MFNFLRKLIRPAQTAQLEINESYQSLHSSQPHDEYPNERIEVVLPESSTDYARITCFDNKGNIECEMNAYSNPSNVMAKMAGNRTLDSLHKFGHTPTGEYEIDTILPQDTRIMSPFGNTKVIRFTPISGECAIAESNGRLSLSIIGSPSSYKECPKIDTDGSLRVSSIDMQCLLDFVEKSSSALRMTIRRNGNNVVPLIATRGYATSNSYDDNDFLFYYCFWNELLTNNDNNWAKTVEPLDNNDDQQDDAYPNNTFVPTDPLYASSDSYDNDNRSDQSDYTNTEY